MDRLAGTLAAQCGCHQGAEALGAVALFLHGRVGVHQPLGTRALTLDAFLHDAQVAVDVGGIDGQPLETLPCQGQELCE